MWIRDRLSDAISVVAFAIRHLLEPSDSQRETPDPPRVDCPVHGLTTLNAKRLTACCASYQFVMSGTVISRRVRMCINPERRTSKTIRAL